ncbi:SDR family NAD(P)-dependent oxidoreductase [Candidatus Pseudothioglobus singularis]|nr:SDR family NAD(P)-dependent oxidoreductase [Candidatus Pseudothioglobus singularis]
MSKNVVISAAADGIGWCIAKTLLEKGYTVYASDINQKKLTSSTSTHSSIKDYS